VSDGGKLEIILRHRGWDGVANEYGPDCILRRNMPVAVTHQLR